MTTRHGASRAALRSRDEFEHNDDGKPYIERHFYTENKARYEAIADRERGALKRLAAIMQRYPDFWSYVQGDPRGAALYVGKAFLIRRFRLKTTTIAWNRYLQVGAKTMTYWHRSQPVARQRCVCATLRTSRMLRGRQPYGRSRQRRTEYRRTYPNALAANFRSVRHSRPTRRLHTAATVWRSLCGGPLRRGRESILLAICAAKGGPAKASLR